MFVGPKSKPNKRALLVVFIVWQVILKTFSTKPYYIYTYIRYIIFICSHVLFYLLPQQIFFQLVKNMEPKTEGPPPTMQVTPLQQMIASCTGAILTSLMGKIMLPVEIMELWIFHLSIIYEVMIFLRGVYGICICIHICYLCVSACGSQKSMSVTSVALHHIHVCACVCVCTYACMHMCVQLCMEASSRQPLTEAKG